MASQTTVLLSLAALVCLAALALAAPQRFDDGSVVFRDRRAAPRYSSGSRRAAASRAAPAYTAPADEDEEDEDDAAYSGEEHLVDLEPVTTAKPVKQPRVRPQRPVTRKTSRPQKPVVQEVEEEEEQDEVEAQPMSGDGCVPYRAPRPQRPVTTPKPAPRPTTPKPARPTTAKPTRAPKPQQPEDEEEGPHGVTAIASAVSQGEGAKSKSQAIALGGRFSAGQYRTRNH